MEGKLNILPSALIAGESIKVNITGVSVSGNSLKYSFGADTPISVECETSDDVFVLNVPAASTLTWKQGDVRFVGMLTDGGGVVSCVDYGIISVAASPLATSDYTEALSQVEAAIKEWGSTPNAKIKVGEIDITVKSLDELMTLRKFYTSLIAKETGKGPSGGPRILYTQFR